MAAHQLVLAPAAKTDLRAIYQYGLRQWGPVQSDSYLEALKEHFWSFTEQPLIGVERLELLAGTRSLAIKSHTVFYRDTSDTVEIIRVLHGRQDPYRHVK
ncbi:MAG: type II toxin-antitoxin system RelE/ParE family toxin [Saccharospirillum sp.]